MNSPPRVNTASGGPVAPAVDDEIAPAVVVVMVAHDPGEWWEDALQSVRQQTYTNLAVLVIDTSDGASGPGADGLAKQEGSGEAIPQGGAPPRPDVTERLAAILPSAHVHRLDHDPGYGPASNEAIPAVEGAAFLLFCHDDVVFDPGAVQAMVEEAFRSNAGVIGPKIVDWNDPERLVQVGMAADKFGAASPLVEHGELDQEQHDAVRDVFYVPGAAMLVRADLFETLGGFDPGIDFIGDDLDFCWRAHVAGARVLVAPAAKVAHRESFEDRGRITDRRRLAFRHRLRTQLICYGRWHRLRVVPQAFVLAVVEAVASVFLGRIAHARDVAGAWTFNVAQRAEIRKRRHALRAVRRVPDKEIRALQVRGSARVSAFLRGQLGSNDDRLTNMAGAGRSLAESLRSPTARASMVAWILVFVLLVFGSRDLLTSPIPAVGEFTAFPSSPFDLVRQWFSGYHDAGLGSDASNPTGFGFVGGLGVVAFGAMGQLRRVLILGLLPVGAVGMWRLARPIGSRRSRIVALVVYVAIPVMTNSIAGGSWSGLVVYALAPSMVNQLARASRIAPFGSVGDEAGPGIVERPFMQRVVLLGLMTALGAMVVPAIVVVMVVMALAMALGGILVGQFRGIARLVGAAVGAAVVAVALHLPWSVEFFTSAWPRLINAAAVRPVVDVGEILRFATGPGEPSTLSWAFLLTGALALLIGRRWRLAWAMRGWALAVAGWAAVFVAAQGWLSGRLPSVDVMLAPGAVGLALASAMGMAAFEVDLSDYHFGWRQIASVLAGAALVVSLLPVLRLSTGGSWGMPRGDFNQVLSSLESPSDSFRMLWIGDVTLVPFQAWPLDIPAIEESDGGRLVYGTTIGRTPTVTDLLTGSNGGATQQLQDVLRLAADGQTSRLGELLAPMGVEYVVVPQKTSTSTEARVGPPAPALLEMLAGQLDLARVQFPSGITVYRNMAWGPITARLPSDVVVPDGGPELADRSIPELAGAPDAVPNRAGYASATGVLPGPSTVYVGSASSDRWELRVNGALQPRREALGWANAFQADATGQVSVHFQTSRKRYLALLGQTLLWLLLVWYLWRTRVRKETERELALAREQRDL